MDNLNNFGSQYKKVSVTPDNNQQVNKQSDTINSQQTAKSGFDSSAQNGGSNWLIDGLSKISQNNSVTDNATQKTPLNSETGNVFERIFNDSDSNNTFVSKYAMPAMPQNSVTTPQQFNFKPNFDGINLNNMSVAKYAMPAMPSNSEINQDEL